MSLQETCQSLCRLIVVAADNNTKLMIRLSLGDEQQQVLVTSLIEMLLVIVALLFVCVVCVCVYVCNNMWPAAIAAYLSFSL